jgi:hypothetical protein
MYNSMASARAIFLMFFAPPLVLLALAHFLPPLEAEWMPFWMTMAIGWVVLLVVAAIGLVGVATAPWPDNIRAVVAAVYAPLFLLSLPIQALIAGCTAGDCL